MKNFKNTLIALTIAVIAGLCSSAHAGWELIKSIKNNGQFLSPNEIDMSITQTLSDFSQKQIPIFDTQGLNNKILKDLPREKMTSDEKAMFLALLKKHNLYTRNLQLFYLNSTVQNDIMRYINDLNNQVEDMVYGNWYK